VNNTKNAIMVTLFASMGQGENHYTLASVNRIIELLLEYHTTNVGRRWVFQCLHDLIEGGYINRRPRYKKNPEGQPRRRSSMIVFTVKGMEYLKKKLIEGARQALNSMLRYVTGDDKRWPRLPDVTNEEKSEMGKGGWEWLQRTIGDTASKMSF